jgi:hypothetical protein
MLEGAAWVVKTWGVIYTEPLLGDFGNGFMQFAEKITR